MSKAVNDFCRKYDAVVGPSSRAHRRVKRVGYDEWQTNPDVFNQIEYQEQPMIELHMPEDRFRALLDHDDWLDIAATSISPWQSGSGHHALSRAILLVDQHEHECLLRRQHPGLQELYEKYQVMLKLLS